MQFAFVSFHLNFPLQANNTIHVGFCNYRQTGTQTDSNAWFTNSMYELQFVFFDEAKFSI